MSFIMINISGPDERPRVEAEASYSSSERGKQSLAAKGAYDLKTRGLNLRLIEQIDDLPSTS